MIRVVALLMALFVSIPAYAQNWDEGGTLRDETVIGWAMSTDANKLASAADYIKASTEAGILAQAGFGRCGGLHERICRVS